MSIPIDQRTDDVSNPTERARQAGEFRGLLDELEDAGGAKISEVLSAWTPTRPEQTLTPAVIERLRTRS
jgi:hypothetical protein